MLDRQTLLILVIGTCIVNGIFSPLIQITWRIAAVLMPELFPRTQEWALFWGSVLLSSMTLLFSGVPAALYERFVRPGPEETASMWIWLAGAAVLSMPAAQRVL